MRVPVFFLCASALVRVCVCVCVSECLSLCHTDWRFSWRRSKLWSCCWWERDEDSGERHLVTTLSHYFIIEHRSRSLIRSFLTDKITFSRTEWSVMWLLVQVTHNKKKHATTAGETVATASTLSIWNGLYSVIACDLFKRSRDSQQLHQGLCCA